MLDLSIKLSGLSEAIQLGELVKRKGINPQLLHIEELVVIDSESNYSGDNSK